VSTIPAEPVPTAEPATAGPAETAPTTWAAMLALAPDSLGALASTARTCWTALDPVVLELCRLRMATLLRAAPDLELRSPAAAAAGLDEAKIAELPQWPSSPRFSPAERAAIALAEQFVIGAYTVTDEQVSAVTDTSSPDQCYTLAQALWAFEALQRTCLLFGIKPDPDALGLSAGAVSA
jgi:alkylhydroperoxidase family enzyme